MDTKAGWHPEKVESITPIEKTDTDRRITRKEPRAEKTKQKMITVLLIILTGTFIGVLSVYEPTGLTAEKDAPLQIQNLMLEDIKAVLNVIVLIIVIVAFKNLLKDFLALQGYGNLGLDFAANTQGGIDMVSKFKIVGLCAFILLASGVIGRITGSLFGSFALGLIIAGICINLGKNQLGIMISPGMDWLSHVMFEGLIIVSVLASQVSPKSINTAALLGEMKDPGTPHPEIDVWRVKHPGRMGLRVQRVQYSIALVAIIVSILSRWLLH